MNNREFPQSQPPAGRQSIGAMQIALGIGVILAAIFAVRFAVLIVAVVLTVRGLLDLYSVWRIKVAKPAGVTIVGIFYLGIGILLLIFPHVGSSLLSLLLAALFIVAGGQKMLAPLTERVKTSRTRIFTGVVSVLLGIAILVLWPVKSFTVLGILLGIEILLNGMTLAMAGKAIHTFGQQIRPDIQH